MTCEGTEEFSTGLGFFRNRHAGRGEYPVFLKCDTCASLYPTRVAHFLT
jgi:hypothetical protein